MDNLWILLDFVNWDDDIPNIWKIKNVRSHQPAELSMTSVGILGMKPEKPYGKKMDFIKCRGSGFEGSKKNEDLTIKTTDFIHHANRI